MASHSHDRDERPESSTSDETSSRRLALVAAVNFVSFVVELAGGLLFGSVALISDALHMLFDMLAYVMAFSASYTAERFEGGGEWSYGLHRLEPIAAFLNGVLLVPMVGYILWESYQRFLDPVAINPALTLVVAIGGLLINLGSVYILQGDEMSLNERGAFYHLLGDAGGSIAVIISTVAIAIWNVPIADPVSAVFIGFLVLWSAGRVLRESTSILLERSPISPESVKSDLLAIEGVESVVDLHVWQVCSQLTVATVQVIDSGTTIDEQRTIRTRIHDQLAEHGIEHATVELIDPEPSEGTAASTPHSH